MRHGEFAAAQRDVEAARSRFQKDPLWSARFRVLAAHVVFLRGSYKDALALLDFDLPAALARSNTAVHRKLVQGLAYTYLQQYDQAAVALAEADALARSINSEFLGDVAVARGILFVALEKYQDATAVYAEALAIARERKLPFLEVQALGNLGYVAMRQDHFDEAIDRFREVLRKSQDLGSLSSVARTLGNISWNYSVVGDFDNAETSLKEAVAKADQAGMADEQVYWLNSLAEVYFLQGRYQEADASAQQALVRARKQDDKQTLANCLNTVSQIALVLGRFADAENADRQALQVESTGLDPYLVAYSRLLAGRIATARGEYSQAAESFQKVLHTAHAEPRDRWEAHARLAELYVAEKRFPEAEREFRDAVSTIQQTKNTIHNQDARISFLSGAIDFYDAYINFLIEQHRGVEALRLADFSRAQTLEDRLSADPSTSLVRIGRSQPQTVARQRHATLLFYWLGDRGAYLWVITPARIALFPLGASAEIAAAVQSYRRAFFEPRDPLEAANSDGKKLYETLIKPAEKLIPPNSRVIVLPDVALNGLNFETLIAPGPRPHYWIDDATIITANSLGSLERNAAPQPAWKSASLLEVGDALQANPDFPPLTDAGKELNLVANRFSGGLRTQLSGKSATPALFLSSSPEKFSYLHFATHGTASRLRPLESAVILSPDGDTYKLYARDVLRHPLNAYLVTISACNGAGTRFYAGEGLVGLSWAFLHAGAHNVIAGLWEVSNASTPDLMDQLYKGLAAGQDPATALRNAKLTLVHSSGNYRKPFYWGPFLLYSGS